MADRIIKTQAQMHKAIADALEEDDIELFVSICDQVHDWLMIDEDHFQISRMLSAILDRMAEPV